MQIAVDEKRNTKCYINKFHFKIFYIDLTGCSFDACVDEIDSRSSAGPKISPPGPTMANGLPLPLGPITSYMIMMRKDALCSYFQY